MGSSRDGGAYASGLAALRSRRLDCVLNSLSGDFIACSVALAREGGTFAEIGKRGVWSSARACSSAAHLRYEVLALDATMEHAPEWTQHALRQLAARARRLVFHGLPLELFDLESDLGETRDLAAARPDVLAAMLTNVSAWADTVTRSRALESLCP